MLFTGREVCIARNCAQVFSQEKEIKMLFTGLGLDCSRPRAQFVPIKTDLGR